MFADNKVMLESPIIKIADGSIINADKVEFIRKYRRQLLEFILGESLPNNQRKGKYNLYGKWYSVEELARIEREASNSTMEKDIKLKSALQEVLTHAKADFIVYSKEFIENGRGSKNIMTVLIQEDCQKRDRADSHLLEWAKTKEGQESTMFERQIKNFNDYYYFLSDLVNFLFDLVHSCPKAEAQFKDRVKKWSAVREILPVVFKKAHVKTEQVSEIEFLKYLKERYLDSLTSDDITPSVIVPLLAEYVKHINVHA
jgi:hypothetical protein